jgi:hypothetical protein
MSVHIVAGIMSEGEKTLYYYRVMAQDDAHNSTVSLLTLATVI